jgi:glycerate-2-kinase
LFIENNLLHIFDQQFVVNALPNIYVIGAGKASAAMAKTVEDISRQFDCGRNSGNQV